MTNIIIHFKSGKYISIPIKGGASVVDVTQDRDGNVEEIFVEDEFLVAMEGGPLYYNKKEVECVQVLEASS